MASNNIFLIVFSILHVAFVSADFQCLCNYNVELNVFEKASANSQVIGYLYEFDCKPVYDKIEKDSKFQTVQFENQIGYVEVGSNVQIQVCRGMVPTDDLVKSTVTMVTSTRRPTTTATIAHSSSTSTTQQIQTLLTNISTITAPFTSPTGSSTTQFTTVLALNGTTSANVSLTNYLSTSTTMKSLTVKNYTTSGHVSSSGLPVTFGISASTITLPSTTTTSSTTTTKPQTSTKSSTTSPTTSSTTTTPSTTTAPKPSCPDGWIMDRMSCYLFHTNNRRHWKDANNDCVHRHSHLAIIETAEEFNFLKQQLNHRINTHIDDDSDTSAWVAGRDNNQEGTWEWYDGLTNTYKPFTYTHWGHHEPDSGGGEHEEDCMTMVGDKDFHWADYHCNENMFYVCEQSVLHSTLSTQVPAQAQKPALTNTQCLSGWVMDHGSCYFFHTNDRTTWTRANSICLSYQAHLAIIETAEEDHFIGQQSRQRIDIHDGHDANTGIWVGGTDDDTEGRWEWADGSSYRLIQGYTNWHSGEPDSGDHDHDEDCMCLIGNKGFEWQDYRCDEHMYFVCEKSQNAVAPLVG